MAKSPVRILVTGAANTILFSLHDLISNFLFLAAKNMQENDRIRDFQSVIIILHYETSSRVFYASASLVEFVLVSECLVVQDFLCRNLPGPLMDPFVTEKMEHIELVHKVLVVLFSIAFFWKLIRYMWSFLKTQKDPVRVLVTGAAGQIGYAIVPMIARGSMLGPDQPVILHLLSVEPAEALNGVKIELIDAAFPLLKGVVATTDVVEACKDVNIAVMLGGLSRKEGMERKDVMYKNVAIYKAQASALEQHAAAECKVLVVANPANTNALILKEFAPSIPEKNITCLTRLDHNRALGQISERLNVHVSDVKNVIIWGNHSSTQYPDVNHATVTTSSGEKPVRELVADDHWLNTEFITTVQQRGAAIIKARKQSSALSAASAACDHIRDWVLGTPKGSWISMGVYSDGSYGIQPGLIYSFPVTCENGQWSIVQGLKIDEFSRAMMDATANELIVEKSLAISYLT